MRAFQRRPLPGLRKELQDAVVVEQDGVYFAIEVDRLWLIPSNLVSNWERDREEMDAGLHHTWVPL